MHYQHIGYGIKGFYRVGGYALTLAMNDDMSTQRLRTLEFRDRHRLEAALEYSGKCWRTLYSWCWRNGPVAVIERIRAVSGCPSAAAIGRLIGDAADKMRVSPPALTPKGKPKVYVQRRPKGYRPQQLGEGVGLDAIERRMGGVKRYILTDIDEVSDYALALARASIAGRRRCSWRVASNSRHSPSNKGAPTAATSSGAVSTHRSRTATSRIDGLIRKRRR